MQTRRSDACSANQIRWKHGEKLNDEVFTRVSKRIDWMCTRGTPDQKGNRRPTWLLSLSASREIHSAMATSRAMYTKKVGGYRHGRPFMVVLFLGSASSDGRMPMICELTP